MDASVASILRADHADHPTILRCVDRAADGSPRVIVATVPRQFLFCVCRFSGVLWQHRHAFVAQVVLDFLNPDDIEMEYGGGQQHGGTGLCGLVEVLKRSCAS
jgi:hypothetical protein